MMPTILFENPVLSPMWRCQVHNG